MLAPLVVYFDLDPHWRWFVLVLVVVMLVVFFMRVVVMRVSMVSMVSMMSMISRVRMGSISLCLFINFPMFIARNCVLAVLFASFTVAAGIDDGQRMHTIDVNTLFNDLCIGIAPMD